jgi:hypothetical protein
MGVRLTLKSPEEGRRLSRVIHLGLRYEAGAASQNMRLTRGSPRLRMPNPIVALHIDLFLYPAAAARTFLWRK